MVMLFFAKGFNIQNHPNCFDVKTSLETKINENNQGCCRTKTLYFNMSLDFLKTPIKDIWLSKQFRAEL